MLGEIPQNTSKNEKGGVHVQSERFWTMLLGPRLGINFLISFYFVPSFCQDPD